MQGPAHLEGGVEVLQRLRVLASVAQCGGHEEPDLHLRVVLRQQAVEEGDSVRGAVQLQQVLGRHHAEAVCRERVVVWGGEGEEEEEEERRRGRCSGPHPSPAAAAAPWSSLRWRRPAAAARCAWRRWPAPRPRCPGPAPPPSPAGPRTAALRRAPCWARGRACRHSRLGPALGGTHHRSLM